MDQEEVIKNLSERLDNFDDPQVIYVDCIIWYADDYSRFKKGIVHEILRRIRNPPILPQKHIEQPILPLYYLVDAISKNCDPGYSLVFGDKLPQVFEQSLYLNDKHLNSKLFGLVEHWKAENIFSESVIDQLQEAISTYKTKMLDGQPTAIPANPNPNPNPQSQDQVSTFIPSINQNPSNDAMPSISQNAEIFNPGIDSFNDQSSIMTDQTPMMEYKSQSEKELRLSREWMQTSASWARSKFEPNNFLIRDLDADDNSHSFSEQSTSMIRLTPENANATCYSCSGTFDRCYDANGEECLKDALIDTNGQYIHVKCKQLQAENPTHALLQKLFRKGT